ncbi:MAG: amidohydrolase family protein [Deltaproteobacteria bacterium]|nr:amidohydrolase family protein [Deltaproteobacteria bacterium]
MPARSSPFKFGHVPRRSPADRAALVDAAMGRRPADLAVRNARVYNPYLGDFQTGDLAVAGGRVVGMGRHKARVEIDAGGGFLIAGFIDSHVHLESSMASPAEFARCLAGNGVTTIVADPHEIANVAGLRGVEWLIAASRGLPVNVFLTAPSCVPATPLERGGGELTAGDIETLLREPTVLGLAEMMNYPGVLSGDPGVLDKLGRAGLADGHAPGLAGAALAAYVGAGISTDHECSTAAEARERLEMGQRVLLRQGTAARNLLDLLPVVTPLTARFCHLATDDRHAQDLDLDGSINHLVALAFKAADTPRNLVLNMATLNPAEHFGLRDLGSLAPGRIADMALYPDLSEMRPELVWKAGELVHAGPGRKTGPTPRVAGVFGTAGAVGLDGDATTGPPDDSALRDTVVTGDIGEDDLRVPATGGKIRVIGVIPGQIVTEDLTMTVPAVDGFYPADPGKDLAKLAVWNRYRGGGPPAVGFVWGLGLKRGAFASTVSHDSHNLVAAGVSDRDMVACARELARLGGGLTMAAGGEILASLPLPLGGLMSELSVPEIAKELEKLGLAGRELGFTQEFDPYMTLSFMSLPVIPALKLTSRGLVDVAAFAYAPLVFD